MTKKIYSIEEIKDKVVPILKESDISKAILFGSYVNGTATVSSDVDIFIDSDGKLDGLNFFGVYNKIEKCLNKKVDLIESIDLDKDSPLAFEIEKYGVNLYE